MDKLQNAAKSLFDKQYKQLNNTQKTIVRKIAILAGWKPEHIKTTKKSNFNKDKNPVDEWKGHNGEDMCPNYYKNKGGK